MPIRGAEDAMRWRALRLFLGLTNSAPPPVAHISPILGYVGCLPGPEGRHVTAHRFNGGEGLKENPSPGRDGIRDPNVRSAHLNFVANGGVAKPALSLSKGAVRRGRQPALGEPSPPAAEPRILL
jgi:hypothetical protein